MTKSEAYILLEAEESDSFVDIRHKYRALMHVHHPDSSGGGIENLEMARKQAVRNCQRKDYWTDNISRGLSVLSYNTIVLARGSGICFKYTAERWRQEGIYQGGS